MTIASCGRRCRIARWLPPPPVRTCLAETWSQTSPTITFTLNGAIENPSATRRETDAGWLPEFPDVAYLRLSSNTFPLDAAYDDFALWNRALSLAEIQALYTANKALGDACGL